MNLALTPIRFKKRAETEFGKKIGIVCGDVRLTYREYGQRANCLSNALKRLGVAKGEVLHGLAITAIGCSRPIMALCRWEPSCFP